jgi:hypothetical protein
VLLAGDIGKRFRFHGLLLAVSVLDIDNLVFQRDDDELEQELDE